MTPVTCKDQILSQIRALPEEEKVELLKELYPEVQKLQESLQSVVSALNWFSHDNLI